MAKPENVSEQVCKEKYAYKKAVTDEYLNNVGHVLPLDMLVVCCEEHRRGWSNSTPQEPSQLRPDSQ